MTDHKHPTTKPYNSNPFTLAFDAFGRLFNTNVAWAVVLLVLGIFGAFWQALTNLASLIPSEQAADTTTTSTSTDAGALFAVLTVVAVVVFIVAIVSFVIQIFVSGMFTYVALQSEKGKSVGFGEAFNAVKVRFWRLLGAKLLAGLKIFGWTLLFVIPGIIAYLRYSLLDYVIMDAPANQKGVGASHTRVKTIVKGRLMEVLGLGFAAGIVPFVGDILRLAGGAAQYNQMAASYDHKTERPKIHWLNYLVFMLLGAIFAFILFVAIIIAIFAVVAAA